MSATEQLVRMARARIPGVDWEALQRQGRRTIFDAAYTHQYLIPAADAAGRVMDTLAPIDISQLETVAQVRAVRNALGAVSARSASVVAAAEAGQELFAFDAADAIEVPGPVLRATLQGAYLTALYGVVLHANGMMGQLAVYETTVLVDSSEYTAKEYQNQVLQPVYRRIADHADMCTRTLNAIVMLNDSGVLERFKKNGAVGAVPLAVVAIVGVLVAMLLGFVAYTTIVLRERQSGDLKLMEKMCLEAQRTGNTSMQKKCIESLADPKRSVATAMERLGRQLVWGLLALTGAGLAINYAPAIASRLRAARGA